MSDTEEIEIEDPSTTLEEAKEEPSTDQVAESKTTGDSETKTTDFKSFEYPADYEYDTLDITESTSLQQIAQDKHFSITDIFAVNPGLKDPIPPGTVINLPDEMLVHIDYGKEGDAKGDSVNTNIEITQEEAEYYSEHPEELPELSEYYTAYPKNRPPGLVKADYVFKPNEPPTKDYVPQYINWGDANPATGQKYNSIEAIIKSNDAEQWRLVSENGISPFTEQAIKELNPQIKDWSNIQPGARIRIPRPEYTGVRQLRSYDHRKYESEEHTFLEGGKKFYEKNSSNFGEPIKVNDYTKDGIESGGLTEVRPDKVLIPIYDGEGSSRTIVAYKEEEQSVLRRETSPGFVETIAAFENGRVNPQWIIGHLEQGDRWDQQHQQWIKGANSFENEDGEMLTVIRGENGELLKNNGAPFNTKNHTYQSVIVPKIQMNNMGIIKFTYTIEEKKTNRATEGMGNLFARGFTEFVSTVFMLDKWGIKQEDLDHFEDGLAGVGNATLRIVSDWESVGIAAILTASGVEDDTIQKMGLTPMSELTSDYSVTDMVANEVQGGLGNFVLGNTVKVATKAGKSALVAAGRGGSRAAKSITNGSKTIIKKISNIHTGKSRVVEFEQTPFGIFPKGTYGGTPYKQMSDGPPKGKTPKSNAKAAGAKGGGKKPKLVKDGYVAETSADGVGTKSAKIGLNGQGRNSYHQMVLERVHGPEGRAGILPPPPTIGMVGGAMRRAKQIAKASKQRAKQKIQAATEDKAKAEAKKVVLSVFTRAKRKATFKAGLETQEEDEELVQRDYYSNYDDVCGPGDTECEVWTQVIDDEVYYYDASADVSVGGEVDLFFGQDQDGRAQLRVGSGDFSESSTQTDERMGSFDAMVVKSPMFGEIMYEISLLPAEQARSATEELEKDMKYAAEVAFDDPSYGELDSWANKLITDGIPEERVARLMELVLLHQFGKDPLEFAESTKDPDSDNPKMIVDPDIESDLKEAQRRKASLESQINYLKTDPNIRAEIGDAAVRNQLETAQKSLNGANGEIAWLQKNQNKLIPNPDYKEPVKSESVPYEDKQNYLHAGFSSETIESVQSGREIYEKVKASDSNNSVPYGLFLTELAETLPDATQILIRSYLAGNPDIADEPVSIGQIIYVIDMVTQLKNWDQGSKAMQDFVSESFRDVADGLPNFNEQTKRTEFNYKLDGFDDDRERKALNEFAHLFTQNLRNPLSIDEMKEEFEKMGYNFSTEELKALDLDKNGHLSWSEFYFGSTQSGDLQDEISGKIFSEDVSEVAYELQESDPESRDFIAYLVVLLRNNPGVAYADLFAPSWASPLSDRQYDEFSLRCAAAGLEIGDLELLPLIRDPDGDEMSAALNIFSRLTGFDPPGKISLSAFDRYRERLLQFRESSALNHNYLGNIFVPTEVLDEDFGTFDKVILNIEKLIMMGHSFKSIVSQIKKYAAGDKAVYHFLFEVAQKRFKQIGQSNQNSIMGLQSKVAPMVRKPSQPTHSKANDPQYQQQPSHLFMYGGYTF